VKPPPLPRAVLRELCSIAAHHSGWREEALPQTSIEASIQAQVRAGQPLPALLAAAREGDPETIAALLTAVSIGETYFFRHPDHFSVIATELAPRFRRDGRMPVRAWSAGCSTGEEAYAVAACLRASLGDVPFDVLGTDVVERSVVTAREGSYGDWSVRDSGPQLWPVVSREGSRWQVSPELAQHVRFEVHNLLAPPPLGNFDVVLCRNVMVYFTPEAQAAVIRSFASVIRPGGAMLLGSLDAAQPPPGFRRLGRPELNVFEKPYAHERLVPRASQAGYTLPAAPVVTAPAPADPVALHVKALQFVERKQHPAAERLLNELDQLAPNYLPGLLERALQSARTGQWARAAGLMRELLQRTEHRGLEEVVAGPEPLPVSFYRASAEAFLARREVKP
jgi:chemotaxis protein methyltransferase CheR